MGFAVASGGAIFNDVHVNGVDAKGRVSLPAAFRQTIEIRCANGEVATGLEKTLKMAKHRELPCIEVYDARQVSEVEQSMLRRAQKEADETGEFVDDIYERMEYAAFPSRKDVTFDSAGRMVLPQRLRDKLKISDDAVFVGGGRTFRIWSPEVLRAEGGETPETIEDMEDALARRGARG